jgi:hypothetical protein
MASPLQSSSIAAPGFFGLNTQESSVTLQDGFALVADNCVIDNYGRLGARKGWRYLTSGSSDVDLVGMHRFIDITGAETIISWSDTKFYTGVGTLTEVVPTTDNTITAGDWQCATLNDKAYFFQSGYKPMVFDPVADTITDVEDETDYSGTAPQGNTVLSAYGRLWVADTSTDKMTVFFSDLLAGADWGTGSSGSINLESILVNGTDEIVGLGAQNGQFIVFCKQNIVVFDDNTQGASFDPATMRLVEVISRVGCVARDSIQNTGLDIFFLSEDGLRSLGRVIQEKSLPMRDLSANVRDDLVADTQAETVADIKSVYSEDNAFYLLLFPSFERIYCFDTRAPLQNGALRVTIWDQQTHTNMLALPNAVYFAQTDGIADYATHQDNGSAYRMKYFTTYFDFGSASQFKILKRLATTVIGGSGQDFVLKAGFDYTDSYQSYPATLSTKTVSEYGEDEYNVAEYESGTLVEVVRSASGGTGNVLQIGFESNVNGAELSLQKLDIFVKQGRVF